jgi:xylitol oxidase
MRKRTFLKLTSAVVANRVLSSVSAWARDAEPLTNWAGNITYSTRRLHAAASIDEVRAFVRGHASVKALGTRHCFNRIADTTEDLLSVASMTEDVSIDAGSRTVTVGAGTRYGQICPVLEAKGLALHNLASLPHISIAGACSTGTHGSGERNGNLSTAVSGLELVTASGDVVTLSRAGDGDRFRGAVVGLGALGVVTRVTLDVQPSFRMRQYVYEHLPLPVLAERFDAIQASAYSVSLFTDWTGKQVNEVWLKMKDDGGEPPSDLFGAARATRNLHPIAALSAENCTEQLGVPGPWYERLPHFRMGFTPSAGKELQAEYFVPRVHAVDAILAIERLHAQVSPHLLITEIRAIAGDSLWLSPSQGRDSVAIHFTWKPDWPAVRRLLPIIERELSPFAVRPHWGKLFSMSAATLRSRYEQMPAFVALARELDPRGKFRNAFLDQLVFGA